jgi:hypothetical protein
MEKKNQNQNAKIQCKRVPPSMMENKVKSKKHEKNAHPPQFKNQALSL